MGNEVTKASQRQGIAFCQAASSAVSSAKQVGAMFGLCKTAAAAEQARRSWRRKRRRRKRGNIRHGDSFTLHLLHRFLAHFQHNVEHSQQPQLSHQALQSTIRPPWTALFVIVFVFVANALVYAGAQRQRL